MTEDIITALATVVVTGGGTMLLVRHILSNQNDRIRRLEEFRKMVRTPNVDQDMCQQRHDTIDRALRFFMETQDKFSTRMERDHDVLVEVVTRLKSIDDKLSKMNGS